MPNGQCRMPNAECRMPNARWPMPNGECRMTEQQQTDQQKESDQLRQRRANFEELQRLGFTAYPHAFTRTHTVAELVEAHGRKTGDELEAVKVQTTTAGRVLAIRSFGKANFLVISDGAAKIQVYLRKDA